MTLAHTHTVTTIIRSKKSGSWHKLYWAPDGSRHNLIGLMRDDRAFRIGVIGLGLLPVALILAALFMR